MNTSTHKTSPVKPVEESEWGEISSDHLGYGNEEDRLKNRGLEDWELVERMEETSDHRIPYWFFAIFVVLLLVAVGLTLPFWGVRPGYERPWFDWGIPAGVGWVVFSSGLIYYIVDFRRRNEKKPGSEKSEKK
ncbi:MAG: hypothetical protein FD165_2540 [Gammaproteobacteria bacterium]|nr:MAG: hypothetical protein FD165_2540 [Gammaproteobacteria bacterium]TND02981.1 MAG: hypothetical protein FD120_2050 [Gammaproteobacteria bacterium]